ncbi:MAG: ATP-binding protein [Thermodesulfobacteriota bacterium]
MNPSEAVAPATPSARDEPPSPHPGETRPRVLLVDDEPAVLDTCKWMLQSLACEVLTAESGEEALRILARGGVHVVVTDHAMAGISGTELLERARDVSPDTVRILYTGMVDTRIAEEALNQARAFRFLVKPFPADRLREAVCDAFDYRRRGEENRRFREEMERLVEAQGRDLAAANASLEGVLRALPAGVLVLDGHGVVCRVNEAATRILGRREEELLGLRVADAGLPCRMEECFAQGTRGPGCSNRQVDMIHPWGLRRTVLWSCEAVPTASGRAGGCVASFLDISDKKNLEVQVFQAKQEIEAIFDSITDPTFVLDPNLRIVRANRGLTRMVTKPFGEVLGRPCREIVGPVGQGCDRCGARRAFETGKPVTSELRTPDGTIYSVNFFPMFQRGRVEAVVGRYRDVTAERELEHRLLQSEKMASIGQLAAGVAHEINNPVGFILSNLNRLAEHAGELAQCAGHIRGIGEDVRAGRQDPVAAWHAYWEARDRFELDFLLEDTGDIVSECREGAERIRKIVADLKTFSHPDAKDWERADLNAGLESTLNIAWNELKYKCEVVRDYGEIPQVLCRPQQVNQVFMNLLVNAAHAIPEWGTVTLRTRADGDRVVVSIADTGTGVAPESLKRIFDPFFTTKPTGQGTGLGLHIATNIVRSHGGEIRVESQVGVGTTFRVALPVTPPKEVLRGAAGKDAPP